MKITKHVLLNHDSVSLVKWLNALEASKLILYAPELPFLAVNRSDPCCVADATDATDRRDQQRAGGPAHPVHRDQGVSESRTRAQDLTLEQC